MERLMAKKVFIANGEAFAGEEPGWFRIVFSQPKAYVEEGLRRMMMAFEGEVAQTLVEPLVSSPSLYNSLVGQA